MGKCVLVVDDHAVVRELVCSLFRAEGFQVRDAANGAEAVRKAQESNPDLIILDLAMPVMNGFEAARALKALMPKVPLMMFTTTTVGATLKEEARSAGISAVISKSEAPDQLLACANALLN